VVTYSLQLLKSLQHITVQLYNYDLEMTSYKEKREELKVCEFQHAVGSNYTFLFLCVTFYMIFLNFMWFVYSDLDKLGGLLPVIRELSNENEEIRTTSAWVLGTASQNNALVQDQVMPFTIHE
jgi:hypothetical protein